MVNFAAKFPPYIHHLSGHESPRIGAVEAAGCVPILQPPNVGAASRLGAAAALTCSHGAVTAMCSVEQNARATIRFGRHRPDGLQRPFLKACRQAPCLSSNGRADYERPLARLREGEGAVYLGKIEGTSLAWLRLIPPPGPTPNAAFWLGFEPDASGQHGQATEAALWTSAATRPRPRQVPLRVTKGGRFSAERSSRQPNIDELR